MMDPTQLQSFLSLASNGLKLATSFKNISIFSPLRSSRIGLAKLTPVIYTGEAGSGGEYHAANDPDNPAIHLLDVKLPKKAKIIAAWYTPLHNILGVIGFAFIDVEKYDDRHIELKIAAYKGVQTRARIAIHVLYAE